MLLTNAKGHARFYVKGSTDRLKDFTIDLAWYHSALAFVASVNESNDGEVTLNLIVTTESYGNDVKMAERWIRKLCDDHKVTGFATWDEYRAMEATA